MGTVTVFRDAQFKGHSQVLYEGQYDSDCLVRWGLHDEISSIRVDEGMHVTLYRDHGFQGESREISEDAWMGGPWKDVISSILVTSDNTAPQAIVFSEPDYRGNAMHVDPAYAAYYGTPSVDSIGRNTISSVLVPEGLMVVLCEKAQGDYGGGPVLGLIEDARDLSSRGFDNRTSSLRVYARSQFESGLRRSVLPRPPELTSLDTTQLSPPPRVIVAESLIPFIYVDEGAEFPAWLQALRSPYYKFVREQQWVVAMRYEHPGGFARVIEETVEEGAQLSTTDTIKNVLSVEIEESGGLSFGFTMGAISFGCDYKQTEKIRREIETTYSETKMASQKVSHKVVTTFPMKQVSVVAWELLDTYSVRRFDDDHVVLEWSVLLPKHEVITQWPPVTDPMVARSFY